MFYFIYFRLREYSESLQVHPCELIFHRLADSCMKSKCLMLRSMSRQKKVYVDISSEKQDMLSIYPSSAELLPGQILEVQIFASYMPQADNVVHVEVFLVTF